MAHTSRCLEPFAAIPTVMAPKKGASFRYDHQAPPAEQQGIQVRERFGVVVSSRASFLLFVFYGSSHTESATPDAILAFGPTGPVRVMVPGDAWIRFQSSEADVYAWNDELDTIDPGKDAT